MHVIAVVRTDACTDSLRPWEECMCYRASFLEIALLVTLSTLLPNAKAHDQAKHPTWNSPWSSIITPGLEGQTVKFDPTKPWGRGQQAPLTAEYRKIHEDSMADQARGGLGNYPTAKCYPGGMPRMMSVGEYEFIVT